MTTTVAAPSTGSNANQNAAQPISGSPVALVVAVGHSVIPAPFFGAAGGTSGSAQAGYATG